MAIIKQYLKVPEAMALINDGDQISFDGTDYILDSKMSMCCNNVYAPIIPVEVIRSMENHQQLPVILVNVEINSSVEYYNVDMKGDY